MGSMWDKMEKELSKVGEGVKDVLDEGKLRIELFRVRQLADRAAEKLGYAVHRAKREGGELDAETMTRLDGALAVHENEARRIEAELEKLRQKERGTEPADASAPSGTTTGTGASGDSSTSGATPTGA